MTDEKALKLALDALHVQRRSYLPVPAQMNPWAQAIFVIEGLHTAAKEAAER